MKQKTCHDEITLGTYRIGADNGYISLSQEDRRRHLYVLGQTGSGKTSFLYSLITQDVICGRGFLVIDPHGDLADDVLDSIPKYRTRDVIVLDPSDSEMPLGFNPLADIPTSLRSVAVSNIIASLRSIWSSSWGARMEHILANTLALLIAQPEHSGVSFLSIAPTLTNEKYRRKLLRHCKDIVVRDFWLNEFAAYDDRMKSEFVAPILNKIAAFSRSPIMRNILGQDQNSFLLREAMDSRKIIVAKFSKGLLTEDDTNLFGSLLVCAVQQQALRRASQAEHERVDFALYLDEFQNFGTDVLDSIVSEARKYRIQLICAHQYSEQIKPNILSAVLGNMGTLALFNLSGRDAEKFAIEFKPFTSTALRENSGVGKMVLKYLHQGQQCGPIYVKALYGDLRSGSNSRVRNYSRERYGKNREQVENRITGYLRRAGSDY